MAWCLPLVRCLMKEHNLMPTQQDIDSHAVCNNNSITQFLAYTRKNTLSEEEAAASKIENVPTNLPTIASQIDSFKQYPT